MPNGTQKSRKLSLESSTQFFSWWDPQDETQRVTEIKRSLNMSGEVIGVGELFSSGIVKERISQVPLPFHKSLSRTDLTCVSSSLRGSVIRTWDCRPTEACGWQDRQDFAVVVHTCAQRIFVSHLGQLSQRTNQIKTCLSFSVVIYVFIFHRALCSLGSHFKAHQRCSAIKTSFLHIWQVYFLRGKPFQAE